MKLICYFTSVVGLALALTACGGSSGSKGQPDATSRKNALNSSVSGGAQTKPSQQSGLSAQVSGSSLTGISAMNFDDSNSSGPQSFNEKCELGGSVSGKAEMLESNSFDGSTEIKIVANFSSCKTIEDGIISGGPLEISIEFSEWDGSFAMRMNGSVSAEGKNAKGEMAPHSLAFKNFEIGMSGDMGDGDNFLSASMSCSGSVVIDGEEKSCDDLAREAAEAEQDSDRDSDENTNVSSTKFYSSLVNGFTTAVLFFERSGKSLEDVEQVIAYNSMGATSGDNIIFAPSLDDDLRAELVDYLSSRIDDISSKMTEISNSMAVITFEGQFGSEGFDRVEFHVVYSDGSKEVIQAGRNN